MLLPKGYLSWEHILSLRTVGDNLGLILIEYTFVER